MKSKTTDYKDLSPEMQKIAHGFFILTIEGQINKIILGCSLCSFMATASLILYGYLNTWVVLFGLWGYLCLWAYNLIFRELAKVYARLEKEMHRQAAIEAAQENNK